MFHLVARLSRVSGIVSKQCRRLIATNQIRNFSDKSDEKITDTVGTIVDEQNKNELDKTAKLGGFAKAFNEITELVNKPKQPVEDSVPFKKLLRNSNLIDVSILDVEILVFFIYSCSTFNDTETLFEQYFSVG